jgi:hypothetical protein
MGTRSTAVALSFLAFLMLVSTRLLAAPEAHIVRIDPRASFTDGAPVLTVVVDLVQSKAVSEVTAACADRRGDALYDCQSEALEQPRALYTPFPFPEKNALFLTTVDGLARPTKFVSKTRWGDSLKQPDVGTAWLIIVDAAGSMGGRLGDAKAVANAFVNSMGPNDIAYVVAISDTQVAKSSGWQPAGARANINGFIDGIGLYPSAPRNNRPLFNHIKTAVNDGFKSLGNVGTNVKVPLHQALVVLSNGMAGTDALSTGPGAEQLKQILSAGRFPDSNSAMPKTPLPVISIWFPTPAYDEFKENAQQFMQNLANTEFGGFYSIMRMGQGHHAGRIVTAVQDRFNQMNIVKYRVSCIAPNITQTFQLAFNNVKPPIIGDSSFKEVPVGIDPTTWPLDVNVQYTVDQAKKNPVHPGGNFRVWGDFCWGGDKQRAEVYFVPKDQAVPPSIEGGDIETAKRAQQQLIARKMNGKAVQATDTYVEFEAPDSDKILVKSGNEIVTRFVIFDNKAARASPADAKNILTLRAETKPFPWLLVGGIVFAVIVAVLLLLLLLTSGRKGRGGSSAAMPAPVVAGGPPMVPPGYGAMPQAPPVPAAPPMGYGAPAPGPGQFGAQGAPGGDFMYGGQPPQYGLTGAQPAAMQPPPDPYAASPMGGASRAVISGAAGTYTVAPGMETNVGRDSARCQVLLQEPRVSAVHATLRFEGGQLLVRDGGSNNGTFLNGNRLQAGVFTPIPPGSMLRFGPVEFLVRME